MFNLKNKNIFVSAAGAGIGRAVALLAAEAGAQVTATDISNVGLQSLSNNISTEVLKGKKVEVVKIDIFVS